MNNTLCPHLQFNNETEHEQVMSCFLYLSNTEKPTNAIHPRDELLVDFQGLFALRLRHVEELLCKPKREQNTVNMIRNICKTPKIQACYYFPTFIVLFNQPFFYRSLQLRSGMLSGQTV